MSDDDFHSPRSPKSMSSSPHDKSRSFVEAIERGHRLTYRDLIGLPVTLSAQTWAIHWPRCIAWIGVIATSGSLFSMCTASITGQAIQPSGVHDFINPVVWTSGVGAGINVGVRGFNQTIVTPTNNALRSGEGINWAQPQTGRDSTLVVPPAPNRSVAPVP
jgi:hypothetical protein